MKLVPWIVIRSDGMFWTGDTWSRDRAAAKIFPRFAELLPLAPMLDADAGVYVGRAL